MARKAKHHYIPKCYLKGFTEGGDNSSQFWCNPIDNSSPFLTTPNDACAQRDYYTINHINPQIIENWYAEKIEPKISLALNYIKRNAALPPKSEMSHLILLLATLYVRIPAFREALEAPRKQAKMIADSMNADIAISNMDEFEYSQTDIIMSEITLLDRVCKHLSNKYYQLHIIENSEMSVITSDNPFLLSHPSAGKKDFYYGLNTPNIEICVPITKNSILIAKNEKIREGTYLTTPQMIGLNNLKLILSARRYFFSSDVDILLVDEDLSVYKHNIRSHK